MLMRTDTAAATSDWAPTPFQRECLEALARFPMGHASADDISRVLKRGRKARLAVTSAFRSLLKRDNHGNPDVSEWLCRLAPQDQWDSATWCLGDRAERWLKSLKT